jgi:ATPase subunit of ABC transporter with duplicated ATPase domains
MASCWLVEGTVQLFTVLAVVHDRYFIERFADEVW